MLIMLQQPFPVFGSLSHYAVRALLLLTAVQSCECTRCLLHPPPFARRGGVMASSNFLADLWANVPAKQLAAPVKELQVRKQQQSTARADAHLRRLTEDQRNTSRTLCSIVLSDVLRVCV